MINPKLQMIAQLMRGRNPQDVALQMAKNINDPTITQMIQFAQSGNNDDLVKLAQSYFSQRGLNLDNEFNNFMKLLK